MTAAVYLEHAERICLVWHSFGLKPLLYSSHIFSRLRTVSFFFTVTLRILLTSCWEVHTSPRSHCSRLRSRVSSVRSVLLPLLIGCRVSHSRPRISVSFAAARGISTRPQTMQDYTWGLQIISHLYKVGVLLNNDMPSYTGRGTSISCFIFLSNNMIFH